MGGLQFHIDHSQNKSFPTIIEWGLWVKDNYSSRHYFRFELLDFGMYSNVNQTTSTDAKVVQMDSNDCDSGGVGKNISRQS